MKIITWNVAGFRRSNSLNTWDYSDVDLSYFAETISDFDPDILSFQEVEFAENTDTVKQIASILGMKNYKGFPMHPNHIGDGQLGYAILSRDSLSEVSSIVQPYPDFELSFNDGKSAIRYDKNFVTYKTFGMQLTTLQLQPLHYWGYNYYEEPGYSYGKSISEALKSINSDVITGDFQVSHLEVPFNNLFSLYKDILPDEYTRLRNNGKHTKSDHILTKNKYKAKNTQILRTKTDHFLCYAEIEEQ